MTRIEYATLRTLWQSIANDVAALTVLPSSALHRDLSQVVENLACYKSSITDDSFVASYFKKLSCSVFLIKATTASDVEKLQYLINFPIRP